MKRHRAATLASRSERCLPKQSSSSTTARSNDGQPSWAVPSLPLQSTLSCGAMPRVRAKSPTTPPSYFYGSESSSSSSSSHSVPASPRLMGGDTKDKIKKKEEKQQRKKERKSLEKRKKREQKKKKQQDKKEEKERKLKSKKGKVITMGGGQTCFRCGLKIGLSGEGSESEEEGTRARHANGGGEKAIYLSGRYWHPMCLYCILCGEVLYKEVLATNKTTTTTPRSRKDEREQTKPKKVYLLENQTADDVRLVCNNCHKSRAKREEERVRLERKQRRKEEKEVEKENRKNYGSRKRRSTSFGTYEELLSSFSSSKFINDDEEQDSTTATPTPRRVPQSGSFILPSKASTDRRQLHPQRRGSVLQRQTSFRTAFLSPSSFLIEARNARRKKNAERKPLQTLRCSTTEDESSPSSSASSSSTTTPRQQLDPFPVPPLSLPTEEPSVMMTTAFAFAPPAQPLSSPSSASPDPMDTVPLSPRSPRSPSPSPSPSPSLSPSASAISSPSSPSLTPVSPSTPSSSSPKNNDTINKNNNNRRERQTVARLLISIRKSAERVEKELLLTAEHIQSERDASNLLALLYRATTKMAQVYAAACQLHSERLCCSERLTRALVPLMEAASAFASLQVSSTEEAKRDNAMILKKHLVFLHELRFFLKAREAEVEEDEEEEEEGDAAEARGDSFLVRDLLKIGNIVHRMEKAYNFSIVVYYYLL
ncbi:Small GTP-binding domain protein [Balamuthia mandrillaris]